MSFIFIAFLYVSSIVFTLVLSFIVFLKDSKNRNNRLFLLFNLATIGWMGSLFFFYNATSSDVVLLAGRANFAVVLPLLYFLFEFTLSFPKERIAIPSFVRSAGQIWTLAFFAVTLLTPLVDKSEIILGPLQRETYYGPLYFLYILNYLLFGGGGVYVIWQKVRRITDREEKYQIGYFLTGLILALAFAFITNIVFYSAGIKFAAHYGVLAPLFLVGFTPYAIFKYKLFEIKIVLVELLVASIVFTLASQVFFAQQISLRIVNVVIFLLFSLFGYLLSKSVRREIRLREELAVANAELKKYDEAKTEFFSIASHQIRAPLTALKGFLSMMSEGEFGSITSRQQDVLEKAMQSEERLIGLVGDFLDFSRIEAGRIRLTLSSVVLNPFITSIIEELRSLAVEKKLDLVFQDAKETVALSLDADKIGQVLLNLIENAIKYTAQGSVTVAFLKQPQEIVISVRDTGRGVTSEEKESLFKKFTRGKEAIKNSKGTGLGLYIAQEFVKAHGGRIDVLSEGSGKGSTFSVVLPLKAADGDKPVA